MSGAKILIVDDEPQIRRVLRSTLTQQDYIVDDARSGEEALDRLRQDRYDLILLDIKMPGMGGLEACRRIRSTWDVAIVMLTALNMESAKIEALDAGGDDYITKPFSMPELLARIRANLRRVPLPANERPQVPVLGGIEVNLESRRVLVNGRDIRLRPKEFDVFRYLTANPNVVVPHSQIIQAVWGPDYSEEVWYLHVIINQIRRKIEPEPNRPRYILTEPRIGYRFRPPEGEPPGASRVTSELCREIVENIDTVSWLVDVQTKKLLYISPAFEKVWGRSSAWVTANRDSVVDTIHAEDRDRVLPVVGKLFLEPVELFYRIVRPDGSVRWLHSRRFPVRDPEGQIYRAAGGALDITDQREEYGFAWRD